MNIQEKSWANELTAEMIEDETWQQVATEIGVINFLKMVEICGGVTTYIPKAESLLRPVKYKKIKQDFNGYNKKQLALKYGLCNRQIDKILSKTM